MIANMRIANITSSPICIKGARAFNIDLSTTCKPRKQDTFIEEKISSEIDLLGTPETSLRGRKTLIARRVLKSTSPLSGVTRVIKLTRNKFKFFKLDLEFKVSSYPVTTTTKSIMFQIFLKYEPECKTNPNATILRHISIQKMIRK